MKTIPIVVCLSLFSLVLMGQLTENFSDGNFSANPTWLGDESLFIVENEQLRLKDANAGSSNTSALYLSATTSIEENTTWELYVQLDFAPSGSNFAKVYLAALTPQLADDPDGYFLKIGGISGSDDAIELLVQNGNNQTTLISGTPGLAGTNPVTASIQVSRDVNGLWSLAVDYNGGSDYVIEGTASDQTFTNGEYFGVVCQYTATRNEAFAFDNLKIDPIFEDRDPPNLIDGQALHADTILLQFDEAINPSSVIPANFVITPDIGAASAAVINPANKQEIVLSLPIPLTNQNDYTVTASSLSDLNNNIMPVPQAISFSFVQISPANAGDLIISEFMADPSPSVGLPEAEFIELYNASDKTIDLSTIAFSTGSSPRNIEEGIILPRAYVIICDADDVSLFDSFGEVASINSFPALTNGGDELALFVEESPIFTINYTDDWYKDPERANGGFTLEMVQLSPPFDCSANWYASNSSQGGTPGQPNSWLNQSPDQSGPALIRVIPESDQEIKLIFDEPINEDSFVESLFTITPTQEIQTFIPIPGSPNEVLLVISPGLSSGIAYELSIAPGIRDCLGNESTNTTNFQLGLAEQPLPTDVIINEVLFNPASGGEDFVELYNRSDKIISLKGAIIQNTAKETGNISQTIATDYLLFPQQYVVITDIPSDIQNRYPSGPATTFLENDLPTLNSDAGNVTIRVNDTIIDAFDYTEDFHFALLDTEKGVSLERISPESPTADEGNWHSAASTVGFATPGLPNSQLVEQNNLIDDLIFIPERILSPDGDGFQDVLLIQYQSDQPGYILNAKIFDLQGRLVTNLLQNELLGNEGTFNWDGTNDEGGKSRMGIHILWIELFDLDGSVTTKKEPIVVASKLE